MCRSLLLVLLASAASADPRLLLRVLEDCTRPAQEPMPCLKAKLVTALDRAVRSPELEVVPGVKLVAGLEASGPAMTENELEARLPRALEEKEATLDDLIIEKVTSFFRGHSLQLKLNELPRSLGVEEGRGKKRKGVNALLMMMFMMASMMIPLKMGTLAMLAGKALIISKLALALAAIVGLKKLLGNDDHQDSYQVVQVPAHSHRKRSLHYLDLPYSAYRTQS